MGTAIPSDVQTLSVRKPGGGDLRVRLQAVRSPWADFGRNLRLPTPNHGTKEVQGMSPKDQQISHQEIKEYYDSSYYSPDTAVSSGRTRHLRSLARRLRLEPENKILDVACGRGEWLMVAGDHGCEVSGIDISETAVAACLRALPEADVKQGVAESLPWEDGSFDVVTCLGSLEHFLDPEAAICEMVRVAKEDAQFLLLVPNSGFLTARLGFYNGTNQSDVREEVRSLEQWKALFQSGGLVVEERWKDLHVLSTRWIFMNGPISAPLRALQALCLLVWPLSLQYQVYHLCRASSAATEVAQDSSRRQGR